MVILYSHTATFIGAMRLHTATVRHGGLQRARGELKELPLLEKARQLLVAFGNDRRFDRHRPLNHQCGIVPPDAALVLWAIEIGDFVLYLGVLLERTVAVREAWWHPHCVPVLGTQNRSGVAAKSRGATPNVDRHVENCTPRDAQKLPLGHRQNLVVQTTQGALQRTKNVIVLHENRVNTYRGEFTRIPNLGKKASLIADAPRHDNYNFR